MVTPKQQKLWFMTDEALRLVQIVAIIMAIGVFVDTTRSTKAENAAQAQEIMSIKLKQAQQDEVTLRVVSILNDLEARVTAHHEADAAVSETVRRNAQIIDKYILGKDR